MDDHDQAAHQDGHVHGLHDVTEVTSDDAPLPRVLSLTLKRTHTREDLADLLGVSARTVSRRLGSDIERVPTEEGMLYRPRDTEWVRERLASTAPPHDEALQEIKAKHDEALQALEAERQHRIGLEETLEKERASHALVVQERDALAMEVRGLTHELEALQGRLRASWWRRLLLSVFLWLKSFGDRWARRIEPGDD